MRVGSLLLGRFPLTLALSLKGEGSSASFSVRGEGGDSSVVAFVYSL